MAGRDQARSAAAAVPEAVPITRGITLQPQASSAGLARSFLRDVLDSAGRNEWASTAELACTELVTNAVLHAHTPVQVRVRVEQAELLVEVQDQSPVMPVQRTYDSYATTGRGMALVAAITAEHGIRDAGPHGKTAWFVVRDDAADDHDEADLLAAWDDATWDVPASETSLPTASGPGAEAHLTVRLLGMPPTLWLAARQHHDAILRELVLYLAEHDVADVDLEAADRARATVSTTVWAALGAADREQVHGQARRPREALSEDLAPRDLDVAVPWSAIPAFARLQDTLDAAERLAAAGALLARPGLAELVAVRDWACEQVLAQHAGAPPSPWGGMEQPTFSARRTEFGPEDDPVVVAARTSEDGVVLADDTNRIVAVSLPLAQLLGWDPQDLVGRRIVTLIPPRFREAHVAGFTRHLLTGEAPIFDVPLVLPVLRADGQEVLCHVLIQAAPDGPQRTRRYRAHIRLTLEEQPGQGDGHQLTHR